MNNSFINTTKVGNEGLKFCARNLDFDFIANTFQNFRFGNINTSLKTDNKWILQKCISIYIPKVLWIVIS